MEPSDQINHELHLSSGPVQVEEFLSVRDAARMMGVSTMSVYGYIEQAKLHDNRAVFFRKPLCIINQYAEHPC